MPTELIRRKMAINARLLTWREARDAVCGNSLRYRHASNVTARQDILVLKVRRPARVKLNNSIEKVEPSLIAAAAPVRAKLVATLRTMDEISPRAHRFVTNYTNTILLSRSQGTHFHSASVSTHPELTLLYNLERAVPTPILMDAILHEAIHGFIFAVMQQKPIVATPDGATPVACISPWTGAALPVSAFCHACLVWFGLAHFWKAAAARDRFGKIAEQLYNRSASGFRHDPIGRLLANHGLLIAPPVARLLEDAAGIGVTEIQPQT